MQNFVQEGLGGNDGLDCSWPAADEDAPRKEVADHTKLRYGCGVCVQRQRLVGGEKYEGSFICFILS